MNYILYSIDWRSRAVAVVGGFATRYEAELARDRSQEKLPPTELDYLSYGIDHCTDAMRAACEQFNRVNGKAASDATNV